jgi:glucosamine 6-phosphate synthetase-like amidotransferase/phosphosugar isomerase protein
MTEAPIEARPSPSPRSSPVRHVVPLRLLADHTACARGTGVGKPRNPAQSVTVE